MYYEFLYEITISTSVLSRHPGNYLYGDGCVLGNQRLNLVERGHLPKLFKSLLELLTGGRVFSYHRDKLDSVELSLVLHIVQEHNDCVQLVKVVNLYLTLLDLGK